VNKEIERLAGISGARMMHTEDGHEVVCFRLDDLDKFAESITHLVTQRDKLAKGVNLGSYEEELDAVIDAAMQKGGA
jgi:hypothetical protein